MSEPRYVVRELGGYRINTVTFISAGNTLPVVDVYVLDSWAGWAVVAHFDSATYRRPPGGGMGGGMARADKIAATRADAAARCYDLNAAHDAWLGEDVAAQKGRGSR